MRPGSYHYVRRTHFLFHLAAYLGGTVALYLVLRVLAPVLTPILAAFAIAYLLDPLADALERRGVGRTAAAIMIMLAFAIVVTTAIAILVPLVADDARRFASDVPQLVARASSWLKSNLGIEVPSDSKQVLADMAEQLREIALGAGATIVAHIGAAASGILRLLGGLLQLLLIPVFAFYFLVDFDRIVAKIRTLIPPRHRAEVGSIATEIDRVVSSWVRGQLTVVAILMVLYPIALAVVGIHLAVPVGILVGLLTFIPYIGTAVGFILAGGLALVGGGGPEKLVGVVVVFVVLHVLESFFLTPRIVGKKVGIGEAGALFAAIAGAELLGFVGVVLAIPLAAAIAVVVRRLLKYYSHSDFYTYGSDAPEAPRPAEAPAAATAPAVTAAAPTKEEP